MDFSGKTTKAMSNGIRERPFDFYGGARKIFQKKKKIHGPNFPEKYPGRFVKYANKKTGSSHG